MTARTSCLLLVSLLACAAPAVAAEPEKFTFSGSVRLRYEGLEGQARAGLNPTDSLTSLRTILTAEYKTGNLRFGGELYDSRALGGKTGGAIGTGEVNTLEPVQLYVAGDIAEPFGAGTKAAWQAGRFTLNLGSRRLIAADDYRNTTNGYTGLRTDLTVRPDVMATLFYVLPQVRLPDDLPSILDNEARLDRESRDLQLWGGLVTKTGLPGGAKGEFGYYGFREQDAPGRPTRDRDLDTIDVRLIRDPAIGKLDYEVELVRQSGSIRGSQAASAPELDVSAWFLHADLGYSFHGPLKARLSVEYDYASGDDSGSDYGRFDTLFGMRRADLAPAGIYGQIGRANISTPGLRVEMAPSPRWDAFAVYRPMWLASRTDAFSTTGVRDATGASGSFAGHQLEGRLRWWLKPKTLRAEINAAWIAKGRFLKEAPNAPDSGDTRYLSVALTSSF
jgi:hypothetical protein